MITVDRRGLVGLRTENRFVFWVEDRKNPTLENIMINKPYARLNHSSHSSESYRDLSRLTKSLPFFNEKILKSPPY